MARRFHGGSATDRVVVSASAEINNLTACTFLAWAWANTKDATLRRVFQKSPTATSFGKSIRLDTAEIFWRVYRAGVDATARVEPAEWKTKQWMFVAGTYNESDGPRIFLGDLRTAAGEKSYIERTVGDSATDSDDDELWVGNRKLDSARAWDGPISRVQYFDKVLSLGEIRAQQFYPVNTPSCVLWLELGWTESDLSGNGNDGTTTGADTWPHPLPPQPFMTPVLVPSERPLPRIIQRSP